MRTVLFSARSEKSACILTTPCSLFSVNPDPMKINPTLTFLFVLLTGSTGFAKDFPVADFGAKGDGKTDDGAAIQKAVDAAVAAGAGSRVVFEQKTYRLDWRKTAPYQISLAGATNIAIEGNGAVLVSHPRNNLISLRNCSGVSVKGFTVDYDPLPFTQGTITEVNAKEGWIDFRIPEGLPASRRGVRIARAQAAEERIGAWCSIPSSGTAGGM